MNRISSKQLSDDDPKPPSAAAAERGPATRISISPDLDRIVLNALRRDPTRRYGSVRALREDLERVLDGRPVTAHAPTWSYWTGKAVRRNKLLTAVTAALLVVLGAASWFAIQSRLTAARQEAIESAFDRTLKSLNSDLDRWSDPNQHVTVAEKTEVVKSAAGLLKDETLKKVAARGDRPQLVSRVVNGVEGVLSRAEGLAGKETPVHKDVSVAYRVVGDFRLVVATTSGGRKDDAVKSYEHAAAAAREVSRSESGMGPRHAPGTVGAAGTPRPGTGRALSYLDLPAPAAPEPAAPEPVQVAKNVPAPARPAAEAAPVVDEAERRDLYQQLKSVTTAAQRSRADAQALDEALRGRGQTLRSDITSKLSQVDMFLEEAAEHLTAGELDPARDSLTKASYVLKNVRSAIGS